MSTFFLLLCCLAPLVLRTAAAATATPTTMSPTDQPTSAPSHPTITVTSPSGPTNTNQPMSVPLIKRAYPSTSNFLLTAFPTFEPHAPPLTANTSLYCFPDYAHRMRFTNVWGQYILEVKEGAAGAACGPRDNVFSRNTVSVNGNELKLQFKRVNGVWQGSEVRVVLPQAKMPYRYGTYQFFLKSIVQRNIVTNTTINTTLPPSLAVGFFSWDDTELASVHENWNHEVDIEISRWGIETNQDAQFLVQPPESPQWYRFYTGRKPGTYDQTGHTYGFSWKPGRLHWYTDAGRHQSRFYTTKQAVIGGYPDRVQCLPANMEIRMNLWNLYGSTTPMGMSTNDVVEVVIDQFQYTPSSLSHVPKGGYCTKHCMCAPKFLCINATCSR